MLGVLAFNFFQQLRREGTANESCMYSSLIKISLFLLCPASVVPASVASQLRLYALRTRREDRDVDKCAWSGAADSSSLLRTELSLPLLPATAFATVFYFPLLGGQCVGVSLSPHLSSPVSWDLRAEEVRHPLPKLRKF